MKKHGILYGFKSFIFFNRRTRGTTQNKTILCSGCFLRPSAFSAVQDIRVYSRSFPFQVSVRFTGVFQRLEKNGHPAKQDARKDSLPRVGSLLNLFLFVPHQHHRRGDEDGGVGSHQNTDKERERKVVDRAATEDQ